MTLVGPTSSAQNMPVTSQQSAAMSTSSAMNAYPTTSGNKVYQISDGQLQVPTGGYSKPAAPAYTTGSAASACAASCLKAYDTCRGAPNANFSLCGSNLAGCLNYNPFNGGSFVTPTACSSKTATATNTAPVNSQASSAPAYVPQPAIYAKPSSAPAVYSKPSYQSTPGYKRYESAGNMVYQISDGQLQVPTGPATPLSQMITIVTATESLQTTTTLNSPSQLTYPAGQPSAAMPTGSNGMTTMAGAAPTTSPCPESEGASVPPASPETQPASQPASAPPTYPQTQPAYAPPASPETQPAQASPVAPQPTAPAGAPLPPAPQAPAPAPAPAPPASQPPAGQPPATYQPAGPSEPASSPVYSARESTLR